jgi:hypothetical protein
MIDTTTLLSRFDAGYYDDNPKRLSRVVVAVWCDNHDAARAIPFERWKEMFAAIGTPTLEHHTVTLLRGVREDTDDFGYSWCDDQEAAEIYATIRGSVGEVIAVEVPANLVLAVFDRRSHREYVVDADALAALDPPVDVVSEHHHGRLSGGMINPYRWPRLSLST